MKKVNKKLIKGIIGFVLICLSILWIIYSSYSNKYWYIGWYNMSVLLPMLGIVFGVLLMVFGIYSAFSIREKEEGIGTKIEAASKVTYKLRKPIIKENIGTKMKAASNVTYMLRIEKEIGESGAERINYICGYCRLKNNLKSIDEEHGIFQCLNCGAENHLLK